jgi:aspartate 1-decarboxylase
MVHIYNINNGERFSTYIIPAKSGEIGLNGAAAKKGARGDLIIVASYTLVDERQIKNHHPKLVFVNKKNEIIQVKD